MSIYVERIINADREKVWELTQSPAQHERWDLRFSSIRYLPKNAATDRQAFEYETRLGFGLKICGTGTTVGVRHAPDGTSTSALAFGSESPWSLIQQGSGYWRYETCDNGTTRFVTGYDYHVRWGAPGRLLDSLLFRPIMAWATAWSFDRLAHWIERGTAPDLSLRLSAAYTLARLTLAGVWLYEAIFPKLAGPHPQEILMTVGSGFPLPWARTVVLLIGGIELLFGVLLLALWRQRWPAIVSALAMIPTLLIAACTAPELLHAPFNVIVVNGMTAALSVVVALLHNDVIRASACRWGIRAKPENHSSLAGGVA